MADEPDPATTRTEITEPWYTKAGQEQFKQVAREEAAKNKAAGEVRGRFNRFRNFLISPFPAYFQRGFKETWREDGYQPKVAAKRFATREQKQSESQGPWPLFNAYFKESVQSDEDAPWSNIENRFSKKDPTAPEPGAEVPAYWKVAVPFYKPFFSFSQDKKPLNDPSAPQPGEPIPPLWSKAGVEYVKKNGIKYALRDYVEPQEWETPRVSNVDPDYGAFKEDQFKDNAIIQTMKRLQKKKGMDETTAKAIELYKELEEKYNKEGAPSKAAKLQLNRLKFDVDRLKRGDWVAQE
jgi:hypothetical protein